MLSIIMVVIIPELRFSEPLQFFHMSGYAAVAGGIGTFFHELFVKGMVNQNDLIEFAIGSGLLVGVYVCTLVFHGKMEIRT